MFCSPDFRSRWITAQRQSAVYQYPCNMEPIIFCCHYRTCHFRFRAALFRSRKGLTTMFSMWLIGGKHVKSVPTGRLHVPSICLRNSQMSAAATRGPCSCLWGSPQGQSSPGWFARVLSQDRVHMWTETIKDYINEWRITRVTLLRSILYSLMWNLMVTRCHIHMQSKQQSYLSLFVPTVL